VIVSGRRRDDCFFSTGRTLKPPQILETFALRWPLEVCFRDVKQFLGVEDPQNRASKATQRTAPLICYIYDLVLLWHVESGHRLTPQSAIERPWQMAAPTCSAHTNGTHGPQSPGFTGELRGCY